MSRERHRKVLAAIRAYAVGYAKLESVQDAENRSGVADPLVPKKGDQKIGLIGEYWAKRYAGRTHKGATLKFGHHSQKGWDIKVERPGGETLYVQVKTASEFGSGKLSKICPPSSRRARAGEDEVPDYWNRLWLIWLDRQLCPETLWMLLPQHVRFNRAEYLEGKTIRRPNFPTSGSACFRWNQATSVARKDLMAFGEE